MELASERSSARSASNPRTEAKRLATIQHAPDVDRIRANTWPDVNRRLDHEAELRLRFYAAQDGAVLTRRIEELDREWDLDRVVEAEAAVTGLTGLLLGMFVDRRLLAIPAVAAAMMLLHATQGWYPLLPVLRRLAVRSEDEIEREKYALKILRGDFMNVADRDAKERAEAAWRAVLA